MVLPSDAVVGGSVVAGVLFLVATYWGLRWTAYSSRWLLGLLVALGGSALAFAATVTSPALYQVVWLYTLLGVSVLFALFSLAYTGVDALGTRRRQAWFVLPAAVAAATGTLLSFDGGSMGAGGRLLTPAMRDGGGMNMMAAPMRAPLAAVLGVDPITLPAWVVDLALAIQNLGIYYASGIALLAGGLLVNSVTQYRHLDTGLGATLAFVGLWPWAAYAFMPVVATVASWETALAAIAGCYALCLGSVTVAVWHYGLFESEPAAGNVGPRTVLEEMVDPVFVLNERGDVLRLNEAAEATFGVEDRDVVGRPLAAVFDTDAATLREDDPVTLSTTAGQRQFETSWSTIAGRDDGARGETLALRDVTEQVTRSQRLQVLTRVLRHNLRNDMTVIRGEAELISDGGVADPAESADTIREMSDRLIDISERARQAQQVVAETDTADPETDVGSVVERVHQSAAERYPEVELSAAVPNDAVAAVDGHTLEIVLENIVENGCQHNDAESPLVVTAAERTGDGTIRLVTRDNGPGIPPMERRVVESGVENPLEHGTGMGLWTVKWGVTRMGGDLSLTEDTPRGTIVQLEIPTAE